MSLIMVTFVYDGCSGSSQQMTDSGDGSDGDDNDGYDRQITNTYGPPEVAMVSRSSMVAMDWQR